MTFGIILMLIALLYLPVTRSMEAFGVESESTHEVAVKFKGAPATFGTADIARLAIKHGGYTTYGNDSSLIGIKVTQSYKDNKLVRETIKPDGVGLKVDNVVGFGSLYISVDKDTENLTYNISTSNKELMKQLLPEVFVSNSEACTEELLRRIKWGSGKNVLVEYNYGSTVSIDGSGCALTINIPSDVSILHNNTDILATADFVNKWEPFRQLSIDSIEGRLLYEPSTWDSELLGMFRGSQLTEREYWVAYAPGEGEKTKDINDWSINNYSQSTYFVNTETGEQLRYYVNTTGNNNIYRDEREYVSLLDSGSKDKSWLRNTAGMLYGSMQARELNNRSETFTDKSDTGEGIISHVIRRN